MPQSIGVIHFKKNTQNALLLVLSVTAIVWFVFNLFVEAYPPRPTSYQTNQATTTPTVVEPLDYHYNNDN